jgi:colanic acid/amylovoran biosynthesis glycosyltransferase
LRIAYLVSRYPIPSLAFLSREIEGLRAAGIEVETISIRRPEAAELLTDADRSEADRTFGVLLPRPLAALAAHLGAFLRGPHHYLLTLARALGMAGPGIRAHVWAIFYFAEAIVVRRHCRRLGITHIHAVQFADGGGDVGLLACHRATTDGREWTCSVAVHGPTELYEVTRYALAEKVRRAHLVVVPAEFTRSQLLAQIGERRRAPIEVVRMGVDLERFHPHPDSGRTGAEVRVLCVARLVPHKGQGTLLRALASLRDDGLSMRTLLVGAGPERATLEALCRELGLEREVEFAGAVGQEDLPHLYAESDICCLPSLAETVGVVNMEAMATARAVVSSNLMGVPELIEDGVDGILVTPGREGELAQSLRTLAADPELRRRLGEAGRRKVEREFDSRAQAARLSGLMRALGP